MLTCQILFCSRGFSSSQHSFPVSVSVVIPVPFLTQMFDNVCPTYYVNQLYLVIFSNIIDAVTVASCMFCCILINSRNNDCCKSGHDHKMHTSNGYSNAYSNMFFWSVLL